MSVTLSISATGIRLLVTQGRRVSRWGDAPLPPGLIRDGFILEPKTVGEAISGLFKSTKAPGERVITSLTGLSFTYRILNLPRLKPALLEEAILRAARKEIPLPLEELYLSWQPISFKDDEVELFVLGVPRNLIDAMVQTLAEARVKPYVMDLRPLALARAANRGNGLIVALEPDCFDVIVVANGIPAVMHTITPREGATIEDNVHRLTVELSKMVSFHNSSHPEEPLGPTTPLLLTGELSANSATSNLIKAEVEYPVEFLVPPLEFPSELPLALYTSNMGLALKEVLRKTTSKGDATRFCDINLNILSGRYGARPHPVPWRRILLIPAMVAAIAILFPVYQVRSQAGAETVRLQMELGRVSRELHQAHLANVEAKQVEDTINRIAAEVDALKQEHRNILSDKGYFTDAMRLVTDALPSHARFTSIEISSEQIIIEGKADSALAVIDYVAAVETPGIFSEVRIDEIGELYTARAESAATEASATGIHTVAVFFRVVITR